VITVNGQPSAIAAGTTVRALLATLDVPPDGRGVAVAVDAEVVPRGAWDAVVVADGAQVEVVTAVQGG
jgi:sulfur carrier protein